MRGLLLALCAALTLSACGGGDRILHKTSLTDGSPDEFGVQPTRTLEIPQSMNLLPTPTPGGVNLADADPQADAIAVLGGSVTGGVGPVSVLIRRSAPLWRLRMPRSVSVAPICLCSASSIAIAISKRIVVNLWMPMQS